MKAINKPVANASASVISISVIEMLVMFSKNFDLNISEKLIILVISFLLSVNTTGLIF